MTRTDWPGSSGALRETTCSNAEPQDRLSSPLRRNTAMVWTECCCVSLRLCSRNFTAGAMYCSPPSSAPPPSRRPPRRCRRESWARASGRRRRRGRARPRARGERSRFHLSAPRRRCRAATRGTSGQPGGTAPPWGHPGGGSVTSSIVPPWSSTKRRATARPRPVPPFLRAVTKGSKRVARISGGTPGPSSATSMQETLGPAVLCGREASRTERWTAAAAAHHVARVGGQVAEGAADLVLVERGYRLLGHGRGRARWTPPAAPARGRRRAGRRSARGGRRRRTTRPPARAKSRISRVMRSRRSTIATMAGPARARTAGGCRPRGASPRAPARRSWDCGSRGRACPPWPPARPCAR